MTDIYGAAAEFYDIAGHPYWKSRTAALVAAMSPAAQSGSPIVDVGAGTGLVVEILGAAVPGVPILAIEPSPAMRAALASRVLADPALARRVTIAATTLENASLPERFGGLVACGVLGYFSSADRRRLWRLLAERLAPDCHAVVDAAPFPADRTVRPIRVGVARIGRCRHELWLGSRPADEPGRIELTTVCRVTQDGRTVRESASTQQWWAVDMRTIVAEATAAGLECRRAGWDLATLRTIPAPALDGRRSATADSIER
ncbi:class I SAM-dependent methyltransferase [Nocardia brasiliensis]|uniref:class I SAM-dependent methyltransferase n=1 Tax=Nocardia brasiliensis TaxID=37326 RepID=UPI001895C077|nr:class I SAM-dependent methyltransferase [Nocardia brasiliensis]MBF6543173.1 class I SAM-dependent methyltransferase [Nocardia brasiliensis]